MGQDAVESHYTRGTLLDEILTGLEAAGNRNVTEGRLAIMQAVCARL